MVETIRYEKLFTKEDILKRLNDRLFKINTYLDRKGLDNIDDSYIGLKYDLEQIIKVYEKDDSEIQQLLK